MSETERGVRQGREQQRGHTMLLHGLNVVLVKTRFPENTGMAARACANMGCGDLRLVAPERWLPEKALPLATPKGRAVLDGARIFDDLPAAVAESALVIGTTARTGGWRRELLHPAAAAAEAVAALRAGNRVSLVFGPEDRGLDNADIAACHRLLTIPTDAASSLNLAQSVLLTLYECAGAMRRAARDAAPVENVEKTVSAREQERLVAALRETLLAVDALHGDNPDYFLMPWRRLFGRARLRRHEYDAFMGLCRQVRNALQRKG